MLISYPLANLFTKLPRSQPWLRHLFNIGVSSFYLLGVFHLYWGWLQLVVSSLATYVIAKYYKGHRMPWVVFMYVICPMLHGAEDADVDILCRLVMGHTFIMYVSYSTTPAKGRLPNLICRHIERAVQNHSYETVEISGPLMVLTLKLSSFAWNIFDGRRPESVGLTHQLRSLPLTWSPSNLTRISSPPE